MHNEHQWPHAWVQTVIQAWIWLAGSGCVTFTVLYLGHHVVGKARDHAHDLPHRPHLEYVLQLVLQNAHGEVALLDAVHDFLLHSILRDHILQKKQKKIESIFFWRDNKFNWICLCASQLTSACSNLGTEQRIIKVHAWCCFMQLTQQHQQPVSIMSSSRLRCRLLQL